MWLFSKSSVSPQSNQHREPPPYSDVAYNADGLVSSGPSHAAHHTSDKSIEHDTSCEDLKTELIDLWKKVWFALFESYNGRAWPDVSTHYDRIKALYYGAGLSKFSDICHLSSLDFYPCPCSPTRARGIVSIQFFDGMSIMTLKSIFEVLKAYESEIINVDKISSMLREAQLDLDQLLESNESKPLDIRKKFLDIAKPMGERLQVYEHRIAALMTLAIDEAVCSGKASPPKGYWVYSMVFPRRA